jgi:hypothetical protein
MYRTAFPALRRPRGTAIRQGVPPWKAQRKFWKT